MRGRAKDRQRRFLSLRSADEHPSEAYLIFLCVARRAACCFVHPFVLEESLLNESVCTAAAAVLSCFSGC